MDIPILMDKSLGMDIPILMEIPILTVNLDHGRLFVESVLENFKQNQLGMPIMKAAISLLVEQHKRQDVSMTIVPFQLELILGKFYLWPPQWQPICLTNGTYSMYKAYTIICTKIGIQLKNLYQL